MTNPSFFDSDKGDKLIYDSVLLFGDCLERMKGIPDKSIDAIICDLPYGTTACKWDVIIPFEPLWRQYKRIIKDNSAIVLFGSEPFSSLLRMSNFDNYKYDWVWNKKKGGNILNLKSNPYKIHEIISVFNKCNYYPIMEKQKERIGKTYSKGEANGIKNYGDERIYDEKYPKSIIEISNADNTNKLHPTQKPVALLEYLIKTYTLENETVLDNCTGSGSTGVACIKTERKFIGIEKEEKYFSIACGRIKEAYSDQSLFL